MKVKICGVKTPEDAVFAVDKGADLVGVIFHTFSKRSINIQTAQEISLSIQNTASKIVGVFIHESIEEIRNYIEVLKLEYVQLHGKRAKESYSLLPPHIHVLYALSVDPSGTILEPIPKINPKKDYLLFDSQEAGSGRSFNWKSFTPPKEYSWFLAGGLNPDNIALALTHLSPNGVDVASGVEKIKGQKDKQLIHSFIQESRNIGRFGHFGGSYIPEILAQPLKELTVAFESYRRSPSFQNKFSSLLQDYVGRKTPLTKISRFSEAIEGPRLFLKREDLLHTGAHKINNALGQCLIAQEMGKQRVIAETGAGQHGVAVATVCAKLGLECIIYMGTKDIERQNPNVKRMILLGAEVCSVNSGSKTLKDAVNEALRDYASSYSTSHYCIGSALGPHPYPKMVEEFQSVIGKEVKDEFLNRFNKLPDVLIACVGGGSNAIGLFSPFIDDDTKLIGVEAGGKSPTLGQHAARFSGGSKGILHGMLTYLLQDTEGQVSTTQSISAGLDYPAVGPHHSKLYESGRAEYISITDKEALDALKLLSKTEGIIPALESSHALAYVMKFAKQFSKQTDVVINLSGRGDKDLPQLFQGGYL